MSRSVPLFVACFAVLFLSAPAGARPVTTDECLAKGLCAYVSPKGRVTCGKCPGQARKISYPAGTRAVCQDDSFAMQSTRVKLCTGHGGVRLRLTP